MSEKAPTAKQLLRALVVEWFPWLQHVKAMGQGLAILAAGGKIHIQGGPDDPAVHRVGDLSKGPIITAASSIITITNPDGSTIILTDGSSISQWVVTGTAVPPGQMVAKADSGSEKVTCG